MNKLTVFVVKFERWNHGQFISNYESSQDSCIHTVSGGAGHTTLNKEKRNKRAIYKVDIVEGNDSRSRGCMVSHDSVKAMLVNKVHVVMSTHH